MTKPERAMRELIQTETGEINRTIFSDEAIFEAEMKAVFGRAWLYVGHESQIPKPGDFFSSRMGKDPVILTRAKDGGIHVLLNSCRHRGMKVCRYDAGNTPAFTCPYHAWTYDLDGTLRGVQAYPSHYQPPFDKKDWSLIPTAQVVNYHGTIWATWDPDAPPFEDYLGDATFALRTALMGWDGTDGATELLGSVQKWRVKTNWKLVSENFAGDFLHVVSHKSVEIVGIGPGGGKGRRDDMGEARRAAYPEGHGVVYSIVPARPGIQQYSASPETADYFGRQWEKRLEKLGEKAGIFPLVGTIFPNMSFHGQQPRTILVSHPISHNETELWRVYFVDKSAPEDVRDYLRRYYIRYSGPGGMTEQDDMENWVSATNATAGRAAAYPFNYKSGLAQGTDDDDLIPGRVTRAETPGTEQNPRAFYHRWAAMMDASNWEEMD